MNEPKFMKNRKDIAKLNVIPMQKEHIDFVIAILTSEKTTKTFTQNLTDTDQANFIITADATPLAYLKLNGLQNKKDDIPWVSMLVVDEKYKRQGIGRFAIRFAEDFVRAKGFLTLGLRITADNVAALNCYRKLGYTIHEERADTVSDGEERRELWLHRDNLEATEGFGFKAVTYSLMRNSCEILRFINDNRRFIG